MSRLEYAIKMVEFHSRLLIKWSKFIENYNKKKNTVEDIPKGQMNIFEISGE